MAGLIGMELSDAGIMAASGLSAPLFLDGPSQESPGYALPLKGRLLVGRQAEGKARLYPLQSQNRFWDQLSTEPLSEPGALAKNHAELAFAHLAAIWERIGSGRDGVILALPGHLERQQLGLIVSMAEELSMPLRGMVGLGLAAVPKCRPERLLLYVDIHLHRVEVTYIEQGDRLTQTESLTAEGKGLAFLHEGWMKAVADEFIQATRFDPLHRAESEQALYDRLPEILEGLSIQPSVSFEMSAGERTYRVHFSRDRFLHHSGEVFREIRQLVAAMEQKHGHPGQGVHLLLSHRVSRVPGCREMLLPVAGLQIQALEPGSGARGALALAEHFPWTEEKGSVSYLNSRPLITGRVLSSRDAAIPPGSRKRPTHIRYGHEAYPLSENPLVIGTGGAEAGVALRIRAPHEGVDARHCTVQQDGAHVVLTDHSTHGTYVNGVRVSGEHRLELGHVIRVGSQELQPIVCVGWDET
jgi:hypothetical protein